MIGDPMTRPIKVVGRWERFKRFTVWHPSNTDPDDEDRWGPRFWYPTYDILALLLGVCAYTMGSPLLNRLFTDEFVNDMAILLIVASAVCLVGVCFPKLVLLELAGKLAIVFFLGAYAGTVAFHSESRGANSFVVIVLVMAVWLMGPRVSKLFAQNLRMKIKKEAVP